MTDAGPQCTTQVSTDDYYVCRCGQQGLQVKPCYMLYRLYSNRPAATDTLTHSGVLFHASINCGSVWVGVCGWECVGGRVWVHRCEFECTHTCVHIGVNWSAHMCVHGIDKINHEHNHTTTQPHNHTHHTPHNHTHTHTHTHTPWPPLFPLQSLLVMNASALPPPSSAAPPPEWISTSIPGGARIAAHPGGNQQC